MAATHPAPHPDSPRPERGLLTAWLLLLLLDGGPSYGYELRRHLDASHVHYDPGNMYRTLRKLEAEDWVRSRWIEPSAGPRRRSYELTAEGRRSLGEIAALITVARDTHDTFLRAFEQAPRGAAA